MSYRLPECLSGPESDQALRYLQTYFGQPYTGAYFDTWAGGRTDADRFTADDLVAVSFLSVVVPPLAARQLLDTQAARFTALLTEVGADRELADQAEAVAEDQPASRLYRAVRALPGVGRTIGTKLLARKRPRLVPIYDSVVARVSGIGRDHWEPLRQALRSNDLHPRLLDLRERAGLGPEVSALRVLDVVSWMEGKAAGVRPTDPDELLGESLTDPLRRAPQRGQPERTAAGCRRTRAAAAAPALPLAAGWDHAGADPPPRCGVGAPAGPATRAALPARTARAR